MAATARRWLTAWKARTRAIAAFAVVAAVLPILLVRHGMPAHGDKAFATAEIVIGVDGSFPPFALDNGETIQGLDIDLASAIAGELNLQIRFVNIGFYALYDALISGEVDLLISALRVDPARMDDVRYTQTYFDNGLVLVRQAKDSGFKADSLANKRIAFEYASSADGQTRAWEQDGQSLLRLPYELPEYALDAIRLEQADAALVDATTFQLYQRARSDWTAHFEYITHEPYAIALRIDRINAWKLVNRALDSLKESGELARIIEQWL